MRKFIKAFCLVLMLMLICGSASAASVKKGDQGLYPLYLNMRLNELGYETGAGNFVYDDTTVTAVRSFQEKSGMSVTGSVDEETWNMLFNESFRLGISLGGIGARSYYVNGKLAAPFTRVEVQDNPNGHDYEAQMTVDNMTCWVTLTVLDSMENYVETEKRMDRQYFDESIAGQYQGSNFRIVSDEKFSINGKQAQVWCESWEHVNETERMNGFYLQGIVELDQIEGKQIYATAFMAYAFPTAAADAVLKTLGTETIKEVLGGFHCGRDRLAEYQAGAAARKKASKLKITLPEFQPVDEKEQSLLDILYTIRDNVNPEADGLSGKMDGNMCVSLYYGAKIMQEYMENLDGSGNPADAAMLCGLDMANGAFHNDYTATVPKIRNRVHAALKAAEFALTEEAAPYLILLGIETPRWTAEDLDRMYRTLISGMDGMIERSKEKFTESDFEPEILARGEWMRAPEIESIAQTGEGEVILAWKALPGVEPDSWQVLEYADGKYAALKTVKEMTATLNDVPEGKHVYAVRARKKVDGSWYSGYHSAQAPVTVIEFWKQAPVIEDIVQTGEGEITLSWSAAPGSDADSWQVLEYVDDKYTALVTTKDTMITLTGVAEGRHTYAVRPRKKVDGTWQSGERSRERSIAVVELWKQAPAILSIMQTGAGKVTLFLQAVPGADADTWQVLEYADGKYSALVTVKETTVTLEGVSEGEHTYAVRPRKKIDGNWQSGDRSVEKSVTVVDAWKQEPVIISIMQSGSGEVRLEWVAAPDSVPDSWQVLEYADEKYTAVVSVKDTNAILTEVTPGEHIYSVRPRKKIDGDWQSGEKSMHESITVEAR